MTTDWAAHTEAVELKFSRAKSAHESSREPQVGRERKQRYAETTAVGKTLHITHASVTRSSDCVDHERSVGVETGAGVTGSTTTTSFKSGDGRALLPSKGEDGGGGE